MWQTLLTLENAYVKFSTRVKRNVL